MSLHDEVLALLDEMRVRMANGRCGMPGCTAPPPVPRGFCETCQAPIIGFWPVVAPAKRRLLMQIVAIMQSWNDAAPLPERLLWWRPAQSPTFIVCTTDEPAMPPYVAHLMTFGPPTRRDRPPGRRPSARRPRPPERRRPGARRDPRIATLRVGVLFN